MVPVVILDELLMVDKTSQPIRFEVKLHTLYYIFKLCYEMISWCIFKHLSFFKLKSVSTSLCLQNLFFPIVIQQYIYIILDMYDLFAWAWESVFLSIDSCKRTLNFIKLISIIAETETATQIVIRLLGIRMALIQVHCD